MPSLPDSIVIFVLALLLFGPKKLPVLARELGKWIGEFRRASNEFKMQMEEELRQVEQAEREQKIAAMEAAAPVAALPGVPTEEPEHPHLDTANTESESPAGDAEPVTETIPIASSGNLEMHPPATGLPVPQRRTTGTAPAPVDENIAPLLASIPEAEPQESSPAAASAENPVSESAVHG